MIIACDCESIRIPLRCKERKDLSGPEAQETARVHAKRTNARGGYFTRGVDMRWLVRGQRMPHRFEARRHEAWRRQNRLRPPDPG